MLHLSGNHHRDSHFTGLLIGSVVGHLVGSVLDRPNPAHTIFYDQQPQTSFGEVPIAKRKGRLFYGFIGSCERDEYSSTVVLFFLFLDEIVPRTQRL